MDKCCGPVEVKSGKFRKVVWFALVVNFLMFLFEVVASFMANSSALRADALDFLGDSANYAISLIVLGSTLRTRASASLLKGLTMGGFGIWVLVMTAIGVTQGKLPDAESMGLVGLVALLANAAVGYVLYEFRDGDSNMKSVWLCTRNDVIGNVAVIAAGGAVYLFSSNLPDVFVAVLMAGLGISGGLTVVRQALGEIQSGKNSSDAACVR